MLNGRLIFARQPTIRGCLPASVQSRCLHLDSRTRLSNFWIPTSDIRPGEDVEHDGHSLLLRGGFLRQSHSGIFHLLPLGLRVQAKLEKLIDKHMTSIGASKLALSSISSEKLWMKSGRLDKPLKETQTELFGISDRRESGFLLSPTHEEEITTLVSSHLDSYKKLPLRLYQTSRKYRDELRPRQGLLRGKEFVMKDLYTFDESRDAALETYAQVRSAYARLFDELGIPYLTAEADSGNMGGKLSHEYHFESPLGEDVVWTCNQCNYAANDEVVESSNPQSGVQDDGKPQSWTGISKDGLKRVMVLALANSSNPNIRLADLNQKVLKETYPEIDLSIDQPTSDQWVQARSEVTIYDPRITRKSPVNKERDRAQNIFTAKSPLVSVKDGDSCPRCLTGHLTSHRTIEVGHTFHLGTRYSIPLGLALQARTPGEPPQPVEMGCHGIGVSRLIGAMANILASPTGRSSPPVGLRWPLQISPFAIVITAKDLDKPSAGQWQKDLQEVYDLVDRHFVRIEGPIGPGDVAMDDRSRSIPWLLKDADLIGHPIMVILGRRWRSENVVEVVDRSTETKTEVPLNGLLHKLHTLISTGSPEDLKQSTNPV